jgi:excinuclease ABC subunit A
MLERIGLAASLINDAKILILDEPTTGLHPANVSNLVAALHQLVDAGHSVVVVEHDMDVARSADWIIDLGPEGGEEGGRDVVQGDLHRRAAASRRRLTRSRPALRLLPQL